MGTKEKSKKKAADKDAVTVEEFIRGKYREIIEAERLKSEEQKELLDADAARMIETNAKSLQAAIRALHKKR